jgi:trk system potassium uptake protein TrkH
LYSFITNQLKKIIYPKGVFILKYDKSPVDDKFVSSIISFIYMYLVIFILMTALLSLTGLDFVTAISGAATSISNVGPGLGSIIGPSGNFSSLPDISKWILTFGMILGRLEIFAILVLFLPSFWRN